MNAYRDFWNVPIHEVPEKTGAAPVMDCTDIKDVLRNLDVTLKGRRVVDVGCGTGRIGDLCDPGRYLGVDIAGSMVAHTTMRGYPSALIDGPHSLRWPADIYLLLSVFTHLPRDERQAYLAAIAPLTDKVLVDILDGQEGGSIAVWFANRDDFETDLIDAGFTEFDSYKRGSPDGAGHLYYYARKP